MTATVQDLEQARIADLQLEVRIAASPDAVWKALTDDIGQWWPSSFYCGSGDDENSRSFLLEARPGGRMWEDWGDGNGLLWGTVVNVVAGKTLDVGGIQGPAWGGPSTWFSSFSLEADGDGTKLRFSDSGFGRISDSVVDSKQTGWRFLFGNIKAYLEGTEAPEWDESASCS